MDARVYVQLTVWGVWKCGVLLLRWLCTSNDLHLRAQIQDCTHRLRLLSKTVQAVSSLLQEKEEENREDTKDGEEEEVVLKSLKLKISQEARHKMIVRFLHKLHVAGTLQAHFCTRVYRAICLSLSLCLSVQMMSTDASTRASLRLYVYLYRCIPV